MCISIFSTTAQVFASEKTDNLFTVEKTEFKNDRITYTISLAPNQTKLKGAIIKAEFDSAVLKPSSESGAACEVNSYGEYVPVVAGFYESGINYDKDNVYSVAFVNYDGVDIGANGKAFIRITFEAFGGYRPVTEVKFYCAEYITDDGIDDNDINLSDDAQLICADSFFTLDPAKNVEVASCVGGLKFTWTESLGAEWYNIYRKQAGDEWEKIVGKYSADTTEYIDKTVETGKEYYYSVEAENQYGKIEYDKTGVKGLNFGTVKNIDAVMTERGAKISWSALTDAKKYTVYRLAEGETSWKAIGETTETLWNDEPLTSGIEYLYTVKAHHKDGYTADSSDEPAKINFIANARIIEWRINKNDIVINWPKVDGAVGYEIYRKATGESDYTLIATVENPGYTDEYQIVDGKEYSYKVRSLTSINPVKGSILGEEKIDLFKLPVTTNVQAALSGAGIKVTWTAVADIKEVEGYVIMRQNNLNGSWFEIAKVDASQLEYTDRAVKNGKTYTYAVRTRGADIITGLSDPSNSVEYVFSPDISNAEITSDGIKITFNKVEGAKIYNIYRKDGKDATGEFSKPIATISGSDSTTYVDSDVVRNGIYVYGVQAILDNGDLSGTSTTSEICFLEEPKVTVKSIYGGVQLSWKAVPNAEKYIVYYGGRSKDLSKMEVVDEVTTTSYIYKNVESGRRNWFAVEAVYGETPSTKTAEYVYYFEAPVVEKIENVANGVKIRWNIVEGATSYVLYRKAGSAKTWEKVATVKENEQYTYVEYTDTKVKSGTTYKYTVKAYDDDEYSPYNETGWGTEFLSTPKLSSINNYYGGPQITWSKVTGATKYEIYRKTKSSDWNSIGSTKSTSYIDSSAKSGTKYYYAIRAVDGNAESYFSKAHFDNVCKTVTYSAALKVENTTSTTVKISWNKVSGAKKYEVYRKAGSAKKWTKVKTTTSASYTDSKVKNGTTYKYMVKALNSKSKVISTSASAGTSIRCIAAPKLAGVTSAKKGVTFKWNKVSGASGYYVYRKTGSGDYEKIATVKGGKKVSYLDKKAKKGKTYTYTVKAYYGSYTSAYRSGLKIKDKY